MQIKNTMGYDSVDSWFFFIIIILSTNVILVNCFICWRFFFSCFCIKKPIEIQLNSKRSKSLQKIETNSYTIFMWWLMYWYCCWYWHCDLTFIYWQSVFFFSLVYDQCAKRSCIKIATIKVSFERFTVHAMIKCETDTEHKSMCISCDKRTTKQK